MRRFSIFQMMRFVLCCAVAVASLRSANEQWAASMLSLAVLTVGIALLGVLYQRGKDRAWWTGYGLFAGAYLVLGFGPWTSTEIRPKFVTTHLLEYIHSQVTPSQSTPAPPPPSLALATLLTERAELAVKLTDLRRLSRSARDPTLVAVRDEISALDRKIFALTPRPLPPANPGVNRWLSLLPGAAQYDPFLRVGHALFAMLAGLAGALIASRFHRSLESGEVVTGQAFGDSLAS
jgi:hypothetical protein